MPDSMSVRAIYGMRIAWGEVSCALSTEGRMQDSVNGKSDKRDENSMRGSVMCSVH